MNFFVILFCNNYAVLKHELCRMSYHNVNSLGISTSLIKHKWINMVMHAFLVLKPARLYNKTLSQKQKTP